MNGQDILTLVALALAALGWWLFMRERDYWNNRQTNVPDWELLDWGWNLAPDLQREREALFADYGVRLALRASIASYMKENR